MLAAAKIAEKEEHSFNTGKIVSTDIGLAGDSLSTLI